MIKSLVAEKVNGIVYAGVGNGNIYPAVMSELEAAADNGIKVVRSARVGSGRVPLWGPRSMTKKLASLFPTT